MAAFTERELDIMAVLWHRGSATVTEVRDALADRLAYTTVLTMLRVLEGKGHVRHAEAGRAHRYFPLVEREPAGRRALARIRDTIFGGSHEMLLTHIMADRDLTDDELRRMRRLLDRRLKGTKP